MEEFLKCNEYDGIVSKIKRNTRIATVVMILVLLFSLSLCLPGEFIIMGEPVLYKGASPVVTILVVLCIIVVYLLIVGRIYTPAVSSLDEECDPKKHLCINAALGGKNLEVYFATDLFLLGDFENSLEYSKRLLSAKHIVHRYNGYFAKARCEYFLGDYDALKSTAAELRAFYENDPKKPSGKQLEYILGMVSLFVALADDDRRLLEYLPNTLNPLGTTKFSTGFADYMKGVAAYRLGLRDEYTYRFMSVKDKCGKTVLARLSDEFLSKKED